MTEDEIAEIGGQEALEAAEERESTLARIIDRFDAAGRHIYHLEPKLTEMFRQTSVDDIPIDLITVPFQTIFIYFGPGGGIRHPVDGRVMDGAYVSLSHADDGSLFFITLCPEFPDLASVRQVSQVARLREDLQWKKKDVEAANLIVNALAFLASKPEDVE